MFEYYDGAKYKYDYDALRREARDNSFGSSTPILDHAAQFFAGLRVLDLTCGIGRWCRSLAPAVKSIVGCDISEHLLEIAREATDAANVSYVRDDAMTLSQLQGEFDGCLHFNFFNHVPRVDWLRFLDTLHARLGSGKCVMMGAQKIHAARRREILTWIDEVDDPVQSNPRGETNYYIVENTFDESLIRLIMQGRANDLEYAELTFPNGKGNTWYATYLIP
jgi:2-polyprenyl-3-methyl-5-hydroxy-6-metoxy-1,4-benzoquinol methylase